MFFNNAQKGNNHWGLYVLTILLIIVAYSFGQVPLMTMVQSYLDNSGSSMSALDFFANPDFASIGMSNNLGFLLLLLMFVFAAVALYFLVTKVHKKKMMDLVNAESSLSWSRILFGFGLWIVLLAIGEVVLYLYNPNVYVWSFDIKSFMPLVLISLLILPIQTSFEELFFRGYLMHGFYLLIRNKWVVMMLTSLLFMAVHGTNPEIKTFGLGIMLSYYFAAGLFLALITVLDDRLELALGVHAGMNFYSAVFVGYAGGVIQTDSMLKSTEMNASLMLVLFLVMAAIFLMIAFKKYSWRSDCLFDNKQIESA